MRVDCHPRGSRGAVLSARADRHPTDKSWPRRRPTPAMSLFRPRKARPARFRNRSYAVAVAAPIAVVALFALTNPPFIPDLRNLLFDWYQRLDPRAWDPHAPVRIVDIDDESLARLGQWPWPRSRIADLVTRLRALDAATVTLDIVFAEPDSASPEKLIDRLPATPGRALLEQ